MEAFGGDGFLEGDDGFEFFVFDDDFGGGIAAGVQGFANDEGDDVIVEKGFFVGEEDFGFAGHADVVQAGDVFGQ